MLNDAVAPKQTLMDGSDYPGREVLINGFLHTAGQETSRLRVHASPLNPLFAQKDEG